ncbi:AAA family ATPase [Nocardia tengchongensis]|uniref:AAA family ATPase n=1 Tax=Nocardia tengchongensis TaxID=2055889 RepID=A0ABX8CSL5_9NOCA|nr:AAA family ATPase [Nocardia tengchongensis]QVI22923.1 AAA family ATPase [Nocardia tengchongensis]
MNQSSRQAVQSLRAAAPLPMTAVLDQLAERAQSGVTVVCGFPASGKSTAARHLAVITDAVIIDKDTFAPDLEESVMTELTGNPHDRDSAAYMRVVNPHIYSAFMHQAFAVANRVPVIVDAPFIGYIQAAADQGISLSEYLRARAAIPVPHLRTIWISARPNQIRDRMSDRGAERDAGKLADWPTYRANVLESGIHDAARTVVDYVVQNY